MEFRLNTYFLMLDTMKMLKEKIILPSVWLLLLYSPSIQGCIIMDFDILTRPLSAWELSCVEIVDNVYTRAYLMQFDLICVHFCHMTYMYA